MKEFFVGTSIGLCLISVFVPPHAIAVTISATAAVLAIIEAIEKLK